MRKEVEKTVVPARKDARAVDRVTKARSKEVKNTAEAMSREESDNPKNRGRHKKTACCRIDSCSGVCSEMPGLPVPAFFRSSHCMSIFFGLTQIDEKNRHTCQGQERIVGRTQFLVPNQQACQGREGNNPQTQYGVGHRSG